MTAVGTLISSTIRAAAAGAALKVGSAAAAKLTVIGGAAIAKASTTAAALAAKGGAKVIAVVTSAGPVLLYVLPAAAAAAAILGYLRTARGRLEREGECLDAAGVALLEASLARGRAFLYDAPTAADANCWRKGADDRKNGRYMYDRPGFGWRRADVAPSVSSYLEIPVELAADQVAVFPWAGEWVFGAPWEMAGRFPTAIATALAMVGRVAPTSASRSEATAVLKWARQKLAGQLYPQDREALQRLTMYALAHVVTP